jgi:Ca2+-dependent lipid-binding protein
VEKKGMSDPYCRIYLVPDDKKSYKRKTKVVKDNLNPKWEETFDYKLTYEQSIEKDLIVSLKDDKKGLFSKQEMRMLGEVSWSIVIRKYI